MTVEAYGEAYQRGFDRTIRLLLSRGARNECAREAAQAAWAKGWERINQLRNESVVTTWVNTIALELLSQRYAQREPSNAADGTAYQRGCQSGCHRPGTISGVVPAQ